MSAIPASVVERLKPERYPLEEHVGINSLGEVVERAWLPPEPEFKRQALDLTREEYLALKIGAAAYLGSTLAIVVEINAMREMGEETFQASFDFFRKIT